MFFKELLAHQNRLPVEKCVRFEHILTQKQDQLKQSSEQTLKALVSAFCKVYWDSNKALDAKQLHCLLMNLKKKKQLSLIPELIGCSVNYPQYIFWAKEMCEKLTVSEQKSLNLPAIFWTTSTDETLVSREEYAYRLRNGLTCWDERYRPCELEDLLCFQAWLDMVIKTESPCLFFNG